MSDSPKNVKYLPSHEWVRLEDDGTVTVGISDHAQDLLGDIVFVELPEIGQQIKSEDEAAVVESVKAASDVYSPVGGEILEVNAKLLDHPEIVNDSPYEDGWFYKMKPRDVSDLDNLLTPEEYKEKQED
jgi:glycine cleavage system H protein